jgi:hypothetical protein
MYPTLKGFAHTTLNPIKYTTSETPVLNHRIYHSQTHCRPPVGAGCTHAGWNRFPLTTPGAKD